MKQQQGSPECVCVCGGVECHYSELLYYQKCPIFNEKIMRHAEKQKSVFHIK